MEYTVTAELITEELWQVNVTVLDGEATILEGQTHVCVETEEQAVEYGERVFLPDLRRNSKKLAGLILTWEASEEPVGGEPV